jgi:hypothetical protein
MDNISLGPFSFITDETNIENTEYIKKTIQRYINKNKNLKSIKYKINILNTTGAYRFNEMSYYNFNFEIIVDTLSASNKQELLKKQFQDKLSIENNKKQDSSADFIGRTNEISEITPVEERKTPVKVPSQQESQESNLQPTPKIAEQQESQESNLQPTPTIAEQLAEVVSAQTRLPSEPVSEISAASAVKETQSNNQTIREESLEQDKEEARATREPTAAILEEAPAAARAVTTEEKAGATTPPSTAVAANKTSSSAEKAGATTPPSTAVAANKTSSSAETAPVESQPAVTAASTERNPAELTAPAESQPAEEEVEETQTPLERQNDILKKELRKQRLKLKKYIKEMKKHCKNIRQILESNTIKSTMADLINNIISKYPEIKQQLENNMQKNINTTNNSNIMTLLSKPESNVKSVCDIIIISLEEKVSSIRKKEEQLSPLKPQLETRPESLAQAQKANEDDTTATAEPEELERAKAEEEMIVDSLNASAKKWWSAQAEKEPVRVAEEERISVEKAAREESAHVAEEQPQNQKRSFIVNVTSEDKQLLSENIKLIVEANTLEALVEEVKKKLQLKKEVTLRSWNNNFNQFVLVSNLDDLEFKNGVTKVQISQINQKKTINKELRKWWFFNIIRAGSFNLLFIDNGEMNFVEIPLTTKNHLGKKDFTCYFRSLDKFKEYIKEHLNKCTIKSKILIKKNAVTGNIELDKSYEYLNKYLNSYLYNFIMNELNSSSHSETEPVIEWPNKFKEINILDLEVTEKQSSNIEQNYKIDNLKLLRCNNFILKNKQKNPKDAVDDLVIENGNNFMQQIYDFFKGNRCLHNESCEFIIFAELSIS